MKLLTQIGLMALLVLSFASCDDELPAKYTEKPESYGYSGEICVVLDKNSWEGPITQSLSEIFEEKVNSLPQPESYFHLFYKDPSGFSKTASHHHSILKINIDESKGKGYIGTPDTNVYAQGQIVVNIAAKSETAAKKYITENKEYLFSVFETHSRTKIVNQFEKIKSKAISEELGITFGLDITAPSSFKVSENFNDFVWMEQKRKRKDEGQMHSIQMGLFVYTYPYTDSSALTPEAVLRKRDTICKKYIHGEFDDTYMVTERRYGLEAQNINFNGQYALEIKGVWKMEGTIMGGPFVSITMLDEKHGRIVCLEGYVHAPQFRKMEFIRELEAILHSVKFLD